MIQPPSFADWRIADFLDATASTEPAPGAGSNAALGLALGLACARKAVAITLKHGDDARLGALANHLDGLSEQALAGGEADARTFEAYIAALKRPHDDPARAQVLADSLVDLVAIGEALIAIGDEARQKLLEAKAAIAPAMINDLSAALALIAAARSIHAACVAENGRALNP